jgi:hypothetical protein
VAYYFGAIIDRFRPTADLAQHTAKETHNAFLWNLCLVSKQWPHPSHRQLYYTFETYTLNDTWVHRLLETVQAAPSLGLLVRRVMLEHPTLLDHTHLLPNVVAFWIRHVDPTDFDKFMHLNGSKDLVYTGSRYTFLTKSCS